MPPFYSLVSLLAAVVSEGDQNLTPWAKKKNDLTRPLSSYKIFSSAAPIAARRGRSSAPRGLAQVFQSLGWRAGKLPLPLLPSSKRS